NPVSARVLQRSLSTLCSVLQAYHDDADGAVQEKNVRHIDGLGGVQQTSDAARRLEEQVRREVEEQVRATGSGRASGTWSVTKHAEYAGGSAGAGLPVRATITGEALEGGDGLAAITTNCHNCRLRIRKIGGGGSSAGGDLAASGGAAHGGMQVESSQARYYSSRSEGGLGLGQDYGSARPVDLSAGTAASRLVQSSQQYGAAGYGGSAGGYGASASQYAQPGDATAAGGSSSRKETKVTKSSWQLSDLGYGTSNIEDLIRRLDEDMRAGRFQNGKTVTTVTTTTSENGAPPVTRQETFVKDGLDIAQFPRGPDALGQGFATTSIGQSQIEDLLRGLREELRSGKTEAGKTVTTVVESSSVNGAAPVVTKKTYVRDGFDASALDLAGTGLDTRLDGGYGTSGSQGSRSVSRTTQSVWTSGTRPLGVDHLGGGNLLTQSHHLARNSTSSYGSRTEGQEIRAVDPLGGGHLVRETPGYGAAASGVGSSSYGSVSGSEIKSTRRVDALGGGHLLRETGGQGSAGAYGSSSYKETRRVDALGGGHLIRDTDGAYGSAQQPLPTSDSISVAQMPGYRKTAPLDTDAPAYGGTSKYYSTFQTSSYTSGGAGGASGSGVVDSGLAGSQSTLGAADIAGASDSRTSSSSSYKKVVKYSSSGAVLGPADLAQDASGNQAFIAAEGGRIPEAGSGSYFSSGSSSYQRAASGISGVNPAAPAGTVVVPVRGPAGPAGSATSSVSATQVSRSEWAETADDEYPPLRHAPQPDSSVQRPVSLKDIGIVSGDTQQASSGYSTRYSSTRESGYGASSTGTGYGATGTNYGASGSNYGASGSDHGASGSNYGASGSSYGASGSNYAARSAYSSSRQYEMPATAHSTSWSSQSTYSSGTPSRVSSSYGGLSQQYDGARAQRMAQTHMRPDCDQTANIKI
ncbi:Mitochondrial distribution and morphology protein 12, partial [Frankliniella fusca]